MGVINHDAVLATTWDDKAVDKFRAWLDKRVPEDLKDLFHIGPVVTNSYQTVVMMPDGSKEGWDASEEGNRVRDDFIAFIGKDDPDRGYCPWTWVEVSYGEYGQRVTRGNNRNCYGGEDD